MERQDPAPVNDSKPPSLASASHQGSPSLKDVKQMPPGQKLIHSLLSVVFDDSARRLHGRQGAALGFELKYDTGLKKYVYVHLFYPMFVGGIGGVTCGVEAGFFNQHFQPATATSAIVNRPIVGAFIRNGDILGRLTGRGLVAGALFDFMDRKLEKHRKKKDWKNFAGAGLMSGAIFGAQGGVRTAAIGSLGFGVFATFAAFVDDFIRKF